MFYNKLLYSKINEIILEQDFIIEEFLIEELGYDDLEKLFDIRVDSEVIGICIRRIYDSHTYLVIYESYFKDRYGEKTGQGVFSVQSPGEVREIEFSSTESNLSVNFLRQTLRQWLKNLASIENIKNLSLDESIYANFEEYSKKIDEEFTQDETFTNTELDEINNKLDTISQKYEDSIKSMMDKEKQNIEKYNELKEELDLMKQEFLKWKSDAKVMNKRLWFKKFPISLIKATRKIPNTVMFLTTALSLGEANSKNLMLGTGLAFISDLTQSEMTASDIIEQQNKNAPS